MDPLPRSTPFFPPCVFFFRPGRVHAFSLEIRLLRRNLRGRGASRGGPTARRPEPAVVEERAGFDGRGPQKSAHRRCGGDSPESSSSPELSPTPTVFSSTRTRSELRLLTPTCLQWRSPTVPRKCAPLEAGPRSCVGRRSGRFPQIPQPSLCARATFQGGSEEGCVAHRQLLCTLRARNASCEFVAIRPS